MSAVLRPALNKQLPRLVLGFGFLAVATAQQGYRQTRWAADAQTHRRLLGLAAALRGGESAGIQSEGGDVGPLRIMRVSPLAKIPERGSAGAVGYDLFASADTSIPARGSALISTGVAMAIPEGYYGRIAPRSGLAVKSAIHVGAGVVDPDYRGEVKVLLFNLGDKDFEATAGSRVAQMILEKCATPAVLIVDSLEDTERGAGGFGSSGT